MDQQIMKMIDKAIVQNHPNIDRLMGCIDNSFSTYTFWTFLFSVNKQIRWKKYLEVKKEVGTIIKFSGLYDESMMMDIYFVFEDKNICYRYERTGIKKKWKFDEENPAN